MNVKFFYIIAVGWLAILYIEREDEATFLIIMLLIISVASITQRIERAVGQIKEPNFDTSAANRKEWLEVAQTFLTVMLLVILVTAVQGAFRCVSSGDTL